MKCDKCRHAEKCPAKAEYGGAIRCSAFKPMTNEEWIKSLDTEQLAEFLHKTTIACFVCGMDGLDEKRCPFGLECAGPKDIIKWLKQKHNE